MAQVLQILHVNFLTRVAYTLAIEAPRSCQELHSFQKGSNVAVFRSVAIGDNIHGMALASLATPKMNKVMLGSGLTVLREWSLPQQDRYDGAG